MSEYFSLPIKPELLAPVGNYEKLETAIHYGADAVYLGGKDFSLRNFSGNFTESELETAISYAHKSNVKVYVTCNIFSRNYEQDNIALFLETVGRISADAVIISDPGVIRLAKQIIPHVDIHLSTQANTTNYNAVRFWQEIGVKRINLARELSLNEIKEIVQATKSDSSQIEIETFVHGAMCISYSGRCLLSNFLNRRDSNRGLCSHPCRWKYSVVEEMRPGQYQPVMEDERGTYIFNSKDLCMINHIPELCEAGITSFKIEGRMKGISYLASVVKTYREAIDSYIAEPLNYKVRDIWNKELDLIYHRTYCTGFYFNSLEQTMSNYDNIHEGSIHSFIGKVLRAFPDNCILVEIKNKTSVGDTVEILFPKGDPIKSRIIEIYDIYNNSIPHAQPNSNSVLKLEYQIIPPFNSLESTLNIVRKIG